MPASSLVVSLTGLPLSFSG